MNLFECKDLTYHVGDKEILKGIDLEIKPQSFTVINGPSGSGKSTLLKLFAQLISKTEGELNYKDQAVEGYDVIDYRQKVSYCFQAPVLFGETVYDNLKFPYDIRDLDFDEAYANSLLKELGLDNFMHKGINDISGGEKQRVALIRNVLFKPEVLLLDEITSALDEENTKIIWQFINKLHQEEHISIISISHNRQEIDYASNLITIENGKVAAHHES